MSRVIRERMFRSLTILSQGTELAGDLLRQKRYTDVIDLLTDCQRLAIALGTRVEELYGMGTEVVAELETYCEQLFTLGECITLEGEAEENYHRLVQQMKVVQTAMESCFPDKKEIVFLPYKASMWDSLESVWMAARDDEDCEAYVIPIPYYDKNNSGELCGLHYEGDLYPNCVPITDWRTYRLEDRHPDVIVIHNPYDDCNTVTSVHPDFYSGRIKAYTEELVYIPYFMLEEIETDDQAAINRMSNFVQTKGVMNADKVIVQSEKMKQIYVAEYLKFARQLGLAGKHLDREYQEKRILGLGSPKVDKVLDAERIQLDIPKEWQHMIENPDGSRKKIVFYNTALTGMLNQREKWLDKIEDTFHYMREEWSDAVLLWRPHPLTYNTIQSMRPKLWERYRRIEKQYRDESWGIYDDTADLDRAITLSDAYFGDASSVAQLFAAAGKPVMIQCAEALYK